MVEKTESLDNSMVQKIKKGEMCMKPKYVFVGIYALIITGIASLFLISAWFANVLFYKVRSHNLWRYLSFGEPGMQAFWHNIPFGAIILALLIFIAGIFWLKRFDICYKKNFTFITIFFLTAVVSSALLMDRYGLNKTLDQKKYLWEMYHNQFINPDWVIGTVIHRDPKGYYIRNVDGRFFRAVPITLNTKLPNLNRSECLKIKGIITDEYTIRATNIYKCSYRFIP
ncbi:hypothetical protein GYA27_00985 [candidate division WWE3 bacterium]|uniref:Uncharacterized protein n=1 Tax=candidate division WWE3 bacterium TaxID=2053526 RepID=A0A7X9DJR7_UNCKA|nr:hypothetical protein [candidate division WWE3 bacterium]